MLNTYKKLFNKLNTKKILYVFYKSLNFIDDDLSGNRGDLDLLIDKSEINKFEKIIYSFGFKKVFKKGSPNYYFGVDVDTGKWLFIDLDFKIRLGHKPFRPYYINIDIKKLKIKKYLGLNILSDIDYLPLMILMRSTAKKPKQFDYDELLNINITNFDLKNGYIFNLLNDYLGLKSDVILDDLSMNTNWNYFLNNYKSKILTKSNRSILIVCKNKISYLFKLFDSILMRLGFPQYRIRKLGFLVSFTGVDGSGKSSSVEYLYNLKILQKTGIKKIYFGNNNYIIPFLSKLMSYRGNNKIVIIIKSTLGKIDRFLRIFIALYFILIGNIVIADRYYYDDLVRKSNLKINSIKNFTLYIYELIFSPKMIIKPKLSFYLDVNPEIAYERKQDYSFEKMVSINNDYTNFMKKRKEVIFINSNNSKEQVNIDILTLIGGNL